MSEPAIVYGLCLITSLACAGLLLRAYRRSRSGLILWTALCFVALALNNLLLVADLLVFPQVDLWPYRQAAAFVAVGVLIYGFIREVR